MNKSFLTIFDLVMTFILACPSGIVGYTPLLIGNSACWADGLTALAGLSSNLVWKGVFSSTELANTLRD